MKTKEAIRSQFLVPHGQIGRLVAWWMPHWSTPIHQAAARLLEVRADDQVVELACGNGTFLRKYATQAHSIAGLDPSDVAIDSAVKANRRRVAEGSAEFVVGDPSELPWPEGRFSAACVLFGFIGLPRPEASLRELQRVLRPGGRALVSAPCNAECNAGEAEFWNLRVWTRNELGGAMYRAGFSDVRMKYVNLASLELPRAMFFLGAKG